MSTPRGPPDPQAMKTRIITHMNTDHALSLRLYLMHYSHVPLSGTSSATLTDITTQHMILTSSFGRHVISFEPEMKSLLDARERLVAMHNECLSALDLSDIVIDTYVPPDRAWHWGLAGITLLILSTFPFREALKPESGTIIASIWSLGGAVPGLARLCYTLQPYVLTLVVLVHGTEAAWLANTKLRRHWVEVGSGVWFAWLLDCVIEGGGCLERFQRVVKGKEAAKNGKH
ncbi:uncharacterized protein Z518_06488 [Rhinocladiella mackenziei CBS 650.93]|uniref:DUF2470 domain-containing protein n=1 Tax=Rhinocladiella mackenziei CBS 650.93 TaxID=1442369 RepID=A0A0D2GXP2_9EURO|nr:uncharacterized protein Z518_06488 [Rhinocladiella mackenziei CBS 650.93]KIX02938.1 hypothetical protein Z518_06488 [Rhinocladiella mackenziei CBS 650.93]